MWVLFTSDYLWTPKTDRRRSWQFRRGERRSVTRACGDAAIAAGCAEEIATPPSPNAPKPKGAPNEGGAAN